MHIILFDDHTLFAQAMQFSLSTYFERFDIFSEKVDILKVIIKNKPDIVLLDIRMGSVNGLVVGKEIMEQVPHTKLIFLSGYDLQAYRNEALKIGAKAFINKTASLDELITNIKFISKGHTLLSPNQSIANKITDRELEVLKLAATGQTQHEIAKRLFISRRTVNSHICSINSKLEVNSTVSAIIKGLELGLIQIKS